MSGITEARLLQESGSIAPKINRICHPLTLFVVSLLAGIAIFCLLHYVGGFPYKVTIPVTADCTFFIALTSLGIYNCIPRKQVNDSSLRVPPQGSQASYSKNEFSSTSEAADSRVVQEVIDFSPSKNSLHRHKIDLKDKNKFSGICFYGNYGLYWNHNTFHENAVYVVSINLLTRKSAIHRFLSFGNITISTGFQDGSMVLLNQIDSKEDDPYKFVRWNIETNEIETFQRDPNSKVFVFSHIGEFNRIFMFNSSGEMEVVTRRKVPLERADLQPHLQIESKLHFPHELINLVVSYAQDDQYSNFFHPRVTFSYYTATPTPSVIYDKKSNIIYVMGQIAENDRYRITAWKEDCCGWTLQHEMDFEPFAHYVPLILIPFYGPEFTVFVQGEYEIKKMDLALSHSTKVFREGSKYNTHDKVQIISTLMQGHLMVLGYYVTPEIEIYRLSSDLSSSQLLRTVQLQREDEPLKMQFSISGPTLFVGIVPYGYEMCDRWVEIELTSEEIELLK